MKNLRTVPLAAAIIVALVAAACGDSGESTAATPTTSAEAPAADIEMVAIDFAFEPDSWTIQSGTDITVFMDNQGTLEHVWNVLNTTIENEGDLTEDMIIWELRASAGAQAETTFPTAPPPGEYQVICAIQGHFSAGMVGTLTITE